MKYPKLMLAVVLNLAALIALAILWPHLMISPGKTIRAHEGIETDCFACHTPFIGSTSAKCIACHKVPEIGIKTTQGVPIGASNGAVAFHQHLIEDDCVACHSDHKGVMAFRPIGHFSHKLIETQVLELCHDCHIAPKDSLHRKIDSGCNQCHSLDGWKPASFDHDDYFRFDRQHETQCETCHVGGEFSNYTCFGCHEHTKSNIRGEHIEEGIYDFENCAECHPSGDEHEAVRHPGSRSRESYRPWERAFDRESGQELRRQHDDDDDDDDDDDEYDDD